MLDDRIEEEEDKVVWDTSTLQVFSKARLEYFFWLKDEDKIEKKFESLSSQVFLIMIIKQIY